jgi:CheY-like chemotaxis protein
MLPALLFHALQDILEKNDSSEIIEKPERDERLGRLRILLAEDNPSNQKFTLQMLKKLGYEADAAVNGQEVLEALERRPYNVIFMDVKMRVMDGIEAARRLGNAGQEMDQRSWPLPRTPCMVIARSALTLAWTDTYRSLYAKRIWRRYLKNIGQMRLESNPRIIKLLSGVDKFKQSQTAKAVS